jgi:hypothetical protein
MALLCSDRFRFEGDTKIGRLGVSNQGTAERREVGLSLCLTAGKFRSMLPAKHASFKPTTSFPESRARAVALRRRGANELSWIGQFIAVRYRWREKHMIWLQQT